jgi:hypothetical protein
MSPQAVFRWLYSVLWVWECFSLLWLWLSRRVRRACGVWIFALLDIFASPLLHYCLQAQVMRNKF